MAYEVSSELQNCKWTTVSCLEWPVVNVVHSKSVSLRYHISKRLGLDLTSRWRLDNVALRGINGSLWMARRRPLYATVSMSIVSRLSVGRDALPSACLQLTQPLANSCAVLLSSPNPFSPSVTNPGLPSSGCECPFPSGATGSARFVGSKLPLPRDTSRQASLAGFGCGAPEHRCTTGMRKSMRPDRMMVAPAITNAKS